MSNAVDEDTRRVQSAIVAIDRLPPWETLPGRFDFWSQAKSALLDLVQCRPLVADDAAKVSRPIAPVPIRRVIAIGEGYRRALAKDKYRSDVECIKLTDSGPLVWCRRAATMRGRKFDTDVYVYRVPVDEAPTDQDALKRIQVKVRRTLHGKECTRTLLAVLPKGPRRYVVHDVNEERAATFRFARLLREGE
jgi:hypothetical protein